MATYLPEEMVVKIFSWLPPKSLIRFKCVSKRWHALIGNPDFLSKNLLNDSIITQNPYEDDPLHLILLFALDPKTPGKLVHSFRSYDSLHCASQTPLNLPTEPRFDIVASCNGLLCLWDHTRNDIYLWNPATSSELTALPAWSSYGRRVLLFHVGFGFDSVSNDYKVIRILLVEDEDGTWDEVEIYSLRCGSWRQLNLDVPWALIYDDSRSVALDRVFLWYGHDKYEEHVIDYNEMIVAFDFSDEEFRTMLSPDARFFCDYGACTRTVTELKGSLAMFVFPKCDRRKKMYLDIWVMLEFGVRESWTRLLSIQLPVHLRRPLGFWKNGELFMENRKRQLALYDLLSQTEKKLQFNGSWEILEVVELRLSSVVINGGVELGGISSDKVDTDGDHQHPLFCRH